MFERSRNDSAAKHVPCAPFPRATESIRDFLEAGSNRFAGSDRFANLTLRCLQSAGFFAELQQFMRVGTVLVHQKLFFLTQLLILASQYLMKKRSQRESLQLLDIASLLLQRLTQPLLPGTFTIQTGHYPIQVAPRLVPNCKSLLNSRKLFCEILDRHFCLLPRT